MVMGNAKGILIFLPNEPRDSYTVGKNAVVKIVTNDNRVTIYKTHTIYQYYNVAYVAEYDAQTT